MSDSNAKRLIASALAVLTLTLSNQTGTLAHSLEPISTQYLSSGVFTYSIDKSRQPVVVAWKAADPNAVIIAIHGFGLHKYAFKNFAERMQKVGISTYAIDVRGFGGWMQTDKSRLLSFPDTMQDLHMLVQSVRSEAPSTPIFLMGESMGGAIALAFAAQSPTMVDGVISSVPTYERFRPIRTSVRIAIEYLLSGGRKINLNHVLVNHVTNNNMLKQSWQTDKQAKLNVNLIELIRFNGFMKESRNMARRIDKLPVLLVQGYKDDLVKPTATQKLFNNLSTKDKQLLLLENGEHLTLEEGQFDESVLNRVEHWLAAHEKQALLASSD